MFLSLFIIFTVGILGGILFEKIRLPRLIWYLLLGIILGPSVLSIIDDSLLNISSILRQLALIIILTRSGLSLDVKLLKSIGRPALLMCFIPAVFEIVGITIFSYLLLDISIVEGLLMGSVIAAVSPAVVVPRMLKLIDSDYGTSNHTPQLIMASSSCDDIFVIILFYSFKGMVKESDNLKMIFQIPSSIILGILLGIILGILLSLLFKKLESLNFKVIIMLGISCGMIGFENLIKDYVSVSALLGIIVMSIVILKIRPSDAKDIQKDYSRLWSAFEILLFVLVGCQIDLSYAISSESLKIIGIIVIALIFRSSGVLICLIATKYNIREKMFIIISYLPKATVQASIGGIALSEGLAVGNLVLTAAVLSILITAPLGAILIDNTYKKLLIQTQEKI